MIKHLTICIFVFLFSMKSIFGQQAALVEVDKVKLDTPNQEIPIIGSLRSKKITNIMAPVAGKVDNVYVEEGDIVKKGQLLAQIDNKNYIPRLKMFKNSMNKKIIKSFYHKKNTYSAIIQILKKKL